MLADEDSNSTMLVESSRSASVETESDTPPRVLRSSKRHAPVETIKLTNKRTRTIIDEAVGLLKY
jgi:hypothetical protein